MQKVRTKSGHLLEVPTPEEDAAITAAALSDPDNPPVDDEFFRHAVPLEALEPELAAKLRRGGRPRLAPDSRMVTLRMEGQLVDGFKRLAAEQGGAYQALMRAALREYLRSRR